MAKRSKPETVDVEVLRAALAAAELRADQATSRAAEAILRVDEAQAAVERAEAEAAAVKAQLSGDAALIAHLRLEIARLTLRLPRSMALAHFAWIMRPEPSVAGADRGLLGRSSGAG